MPRACRFCPRARWLLWLHATEQVIFQARLIFPAVYISFTGLLKNIRWAHDSLCRAHILLELHVRWAGKLNVWCQPLKMPWNFSGQIDGWKVGWLVIWVIVGQTDIYPDKNGRTDKQTRNIMPPVPTGGGIKMPSISAIPFPIHSIYIWNI